MDIRTNDPYTRFGAELRREIDRRGEPAYVESYGLPVYGHCLLGARIRPRDEITVTFNDGYQLAVPQPIPAEMVHTEIMKSEIDKSTVTKVTLTNTPERTRCDVHRANVNAAMSVTSSLSAAQDLFDYATEAMYRGGPKVLCEKDLAVGDRFAYAHPSGATYRVVTINSTGVREVMHESTSVVHQSEPNRVVVKC